MQGTPINNIANYYDQIKFPTLCRRSNSNMATAQAICRKLDILSSKHMIALNAEILEVLNGCETKIWTTKDKNYSLGSPSVYGRHVAYKQLKHNNSEVLQKYNKIVDQVLNPINKAKQDILKSNNLAKMYFLEKELLNTLDLSKYFIYEGYNIKAKDNITELAMQTKHCFRSMSHPVIFKMQSGSYLSLSECSQIISLSVSDDSSKYKTFVSGESFISIFSYSDSDSDSEEDNPAFVTPKKLHTNYKSSIFLKKKHTSSFETTELKPKTFGKSCIKFKHKKVNKSFYPPSIQNYRNSKSTVRLDDITTVQKKLRQAERLKKYAAKNYPAFLNGELKQDIIKLKKTLKLLEQKNEGTSYNYKK